ncbi:hypothetical protein C0995_006462 [Termitomyces sp. Mi166|nr:hypothetical protein C0995_006462 [Termitomyces sp. Mi166\
MWRSLLKSLLPSKHQTQEHNSTVAPAAPICMHGHQWWDEDNSNTIRLPTPSPYERLPACGYWSPSSSYASSSSNDLPWSVARGDVTPPESPRDDNDNADNYIVNLLDACPLKRVLAIGRREGESIRRRRKIHKIIPPAELVEGLGMMFIDRSTSFPLDVQMEEEEEEEEEVRAPIPVRRAGVWIIVEEVDDSEDEED